MFSVDASRDEGSTMEAANAVFHCSKKQKRMEDTKQHASSVEYDNKEAKKKLFQTLVGLKLNVPEHWWVDSRRKKLWKCIVESINLDDEYGRYFIIKCIDDDALHRNCYPMSYEDIRKYMDVEQDKAFMFELPDVGL